MNRVQLKAGDRVVIKIGTNSIMKSSLEVDYKQLDRIAYTASVLNQNGIQPIIVSSGAIGVGASVLDIESYPTSIPDQQAVSCVGQSHLMTLFNQFFSHYNQTIGQLLITRDVVDFPVSYENVRNALDKILENRIIPIINENDAVSVDEMNHKTRFGDNDTLSAVVAQIVQADLLVLLTDIDGLYTKNPHQHEDAELISYVSEITPEVVDMASGKGSEFSRGGMLTKIQAAEYAMGHGIPMVICLSEDPTILFDVVAGEEIGTYFEGRNSNDSD